MKDKNDKNDKWVIKPINDRVAIEYVDHDEKSAGGIYIPDTSKEKKERRLRGTVIALGQGVVEKGIGGEDLLRNFRVKVGDVVLFTQYAGSEHVIDGRKVCFQLESEIVAILKESNE